MKKIFKIIMVVTFCFTVVGIASAADIKPGESMQKPEALQGFPIPPPIFACPTGWTKKPNVLACVPSKPAPISCPKGYQYYEKLACTASTIFGGCQVEGCEIGCSKIPEVPR
jgi:hypothetical protein